MYYGLGGWFECGNQALVRAAGRGRLGVASGVRGACAAGDTATECGAAPALQPGLRDQLSSY